ncbi:MAG: hypothetical protein KJ808_10450 [Acidobacteria bacterium]|nr:hypothetical protein [Acidobacteriota bacterium]MBU4306411.1 hypothetical protein [Acidobacteriota bacterium]MCG2811738.1 hypothetical protein [Candidatus Aminicenantes bacterium]
MIEAAQDRRQQYWHAHIESWKSSKLSRSAYCRQAGISYDVFQYWLRRPLKAHPQKALSVVKIAERLELSSLPRLSQISVSRSLTLWLGEYRIEVCQGFCPQTLTQLVHTLRAI